MGGKLRTFDGKAESISRNNIFRREYSMKKPYVFLDFDGTVLNTNEVIIDSWNATARHFLGHEIDRKTILGTFGEPIRFTAGNFFPDNEVEEIVKYYREYQNANSEGKVELFEGMKEFLQELKREGFKLAIVTSRTKTTSFAYMDDFGITDIFDVVITCDDTTAHKPDPEPLLIAIEKMESLLGKSIDRADCVMVGDTRFDIGCAQNAGVDGVLVSWAHESGEDRLKSSGIEAKYTISSINELKELIG